MDIYEIRKQNLIQFLEDNDGAAKIAAKYDIDATYLSQLKGGHRRFGEKAARKAEVKLGLTPFYFDKPLAMKQSLARYTLDEELKDMSEAQIKAMLNIARTLKEPDKGNGTH